MMVVTTLEATMNMMQLKYVPEHNQWARWLWRVLEDIWGKAVGWKASFYQCFWVFSRMLEYLVDLGPFFLLQPTAFITLFLSTRNAKKDLKANVASLVNNTDITELISCRCASSRGVYFSWFSLTGSLLSDLLFGRFLAFLSVRKCTTVSVLKTSSTSQPFVLFLQFRLFLFILHFRLN